MPRSGGRSYKEVIKGAANYCFKLQDLRQVDTIGGAVDILVAAIEQVFSDYRRSRKRVVEFKIGKTNVQEYKQKKTDKKKKARKRKKERKARKVHPLKPKTFKKTGISSRWNYHKKKNYGKNGMVVLAVVTKSVAKKLGYRDAEKCALAIEKKLQRKFHGIKDTDSDSDTPSPSQSSSSESSSSSDSKEDTDSDTDTSSNKDPDDDDDDEPPRLVNNRHYRPGPKCPGRPGYPIYMVQKTCAVA